MYKMVDMAHTPAEMKEEAASSIPCSTGAPKYPYGLCIRLGKDELEKLDLGCDCEVGDMIHLFAMAKVTSVSAYETENGSSQNVELQITHLGLENEEEEEEEVQKLGRKVHTRLYS